MVVTRAQAQEMYCCSCTQGRETARCLADKCMAWRWTQYRNSDPRLPPVAVHERTGYCGIGGKP